MKHAKRKLASVAAILVASTLSMVGAASANGFGAIAFSPGSGSHGFSYGYPSRGAAEQVAMRNCHKYAGDCRIAIWFRNACGALAVGAGYGWGAGYAAGKQGAETIAMGYCRQHAGNCRIVRSYCS